MPLVMSGGVLDVGAHPGADPLVPLDLLDVDARPEAAGVVPGELPVRYGD